MLTRLTDRFEEKEDGKKRRILRYGVWGTSSEIEGRGRKKWIVIHKNKQEKEFTSLEEAGAYLEEYVRRGCKWG